MSALQNLFLKSEEVKRARAESQFWGCYAHQKAVEERHAELESHASQYWAKEKIAENFGEITDRERKLVLAAASYVVYGRFEPKPKETNE